MIEMHNALSVTNAIYAAAEGQESWSRSLERLADLLGYAAGTLEIHNISAGGMLDFASARLDPAANDVYARDFAADNPRVEHMKTADSRITFDHLFFTERQMDTDRFYADFLRPHDLRYFVAVEAPLINGEIRAAITLQRSGAESGVDEHNIALLKRIEPHLTRAMTLYWARAQSAIDPAFLKRNLNGCGLTLAEHHLAASFASGETLADFATRKGVSMNTVYTHYRRLKEKLDCRSQAELAARLSEISRVSGH